MWRSPAGGLASLPFGSRTRAEHIERTADDPCEVGDFVLFNDEYFEWTNLMEAVLDAGDTFTFVELGTGFGRWTSRAAGLARIKGKRFRAPLVEADPKHAAWAREHMADNGIEDYRLVEAAVGAERRRTQLVIGRPPVMESSGNWYDQTIWTPDYTYPSDQSHMGHPVFTDSMGWRFIETDEVTIADVIEPFDFVDLLDMDIQGSEGVAVRASIEALTAKVRRTYIETHNHPVEADLRESLAAAGWRRLRDYDCLQENQTAFSRAYMVGGVQCWINPRLL
jgi:FkbM family methyltransferase